jgi:hypothetical protein
VVGLADDADAPVVEIGDPQLPQRAVVAQRRRHDLVDEAVEVAVLAAQHVVGYVEARIVDPDGIVEAERDVLEALAVARRAVQAPGDVLADRVEGRRRAAGGRFEQRRPADVHRRLLGLDREKRGVESGQARGRGHVGSYGAGAPAGHCAASGAAPRTAAVSLSRSRCA